VTEQVLDPVIQIVIASALAVLWLAAAAQKLAHLSEFRVTAADYRVVPQALALPSAVIVIGLELGLGIALLAPSGRTPALVGSAALLLLYAVFIGVNLVRGRRHIDCGCSGPGLRQPLGAWLVYRNVALVATALMGALPVEARALHWIDVVSILAAVGALAALYPTLDRLISNARELASLGRPT
jgi:hypothetical protein